MNTTINEARSHYTAIARHNANLRRQSRWMYWADSRFEYIVMAEKFGEIGSTVQYTKVPLK